MHRSRFVAVLCSGASTEELRDAFADLGLTGIGTGDPRRALRDIRTAILHNL